MYDFTQCTHIFIPRALDSQILHLLLHKSKESRWEFCKIILTCSTHNNLILKSLGFKNVMASNNILMFDILFDHFSFPWNYRCRCRNIFTSLYRDFIFMCLQTLLIFNLHSKFTQLFWFLIAHMNSYYIVQVLHVLMFLMIITLLHTLLTQFTTTVYWMTATGCCKMNKWTSS